MRGTVTTRCFSENFTNIQGHSWYGLDGFLGTNQYSELAGENFRKLQIMKFLTYQIGFEEKKMVKKSLKI